jgi:hypothetical protein
MYNFRAHLCVAYDSKETVIISLRMRGSVFSMGQELKFEA